MGCPENIIPIHDSETARKRGSNGGKASGKVRRDKRDLRKVLQELLAMPSEDGEGGSNVEALAAAMLRRALKGDARSAEFIRDSAFGKPTVHQQIEASTVSRLVLFGDEGVVIDPGKVDELRQ